jgi:hypothetical protein
VSMGCGSGSCPLAGFGISVDQFSGRTTEELVSPLVYQLVSLLVPELVLSY